MQNNKFLQANLLIAVSGILYGFLGYLGTGALQENISISTMLFWRFLIAGSWMFLFIVKNHLKQPALNHPVDRRALFFVFFLGALGYAGASEFYFIASQHIGTGIAMVIFFAYPIIITLASWLIFHQKINLGTTLILVAMTIGLLLLQRSNTYQFNALGIFFGLISATCYAFYVMGGKYISSSMNSNTLTMIVCFGCTFIFLIISIATHTFIVPSSIRSWLYLLAFGILATALPIQLMFEGLKYVSSIRASIISVLEPLVTVLVGILLLNESLSYLQALGALIILGSTLLVIGSSRPMTQVD